MNSTRGEVGDFSGIFVATRDRLGRESRRVCNGGLTGDLLGDSFWSPGDCGDSQWDDGSFMEGTM